MSWHRFHVQEAAPGARVVLPQHTAHHARDVLRLGSGAEVRVFDGRGAEFEGVLETVSRRVVTARLGAAVRPRPESSLRLDLALSPLKGDRMELVIQKATELGVTAIHPVVTARTDAAARPALRGSRQERWEKVASGAAEQSSRAVVPEIAATLPLAEFLTRPFDGSKLLLSETEGVTPFPRAPGPAVGKGVLLLLGPAGGWERSESEQAAAAGFIQVSLGPRILRAETAAIAAVALAQSLWGDLG
jgi:16S rRNA (uracil1498-N3)-methyltransferase